MAQPFNASNKPGTCLWCGRKLRGMTRERRYQHPVDGEIRVEVHPSRDPNRWPGLFDTGGCAEMFGANFAGLGHRLKPKGE